MATTEQRVSALETNMATKADIQTMLDAMEARIDDRLTAFKQEILDAFQRGFTSNY